MLGMVTVVGSSDPVGWGLAGWSDAVMPGCCSCIAEGLLELLREMGERVWPFKGAAAAAPGYWRIRLVRCAERAGAQLTRLGNASSRGGIPLDAHPTVQVFQCDMREPLDPGIGFVQARDVVEVAAACLAERSTVFHGDLFQRFQAVGHESRTEDVDAPGILSAELLHDFHGIGLEPLSAAEARLKGHEILIRVQFERQGEQARGLVAFAVI